MPAAMFRSAASSAERQRGNTTGTKLRFLPEHRPCCEPPFFYQRGRGMPVPSMGS